MERVLHFKNVFGLSIETAKNTKITASLKHAQLKTANSNSPWAYIGEGLFSEGSASEIWGAYFQEGLFLRGLIIRILRYSIKWLSTK